MTQSNKKYLIYILAFTYILVIPVYQLAHVHTAETDCVQSIIYFFGHEHHHDAEADDHQHPDHAELHVHADQFYNTPINKTALGNNGLQHSQAIIPTLRFNPELDLCSLIHRTFPATPTDWQTKPLQGRSPPIFV